MSNDRVRFCLLNNFSFSKPLVAVLLALCVAENSSYAWGERGHDLIARAAARTLANGRRHGPALSAPFLMKEHMLGHLANVPDIVWRNVADKSVIEANSPTHYVDLEFVADALDLAHMPTSPEALQAFLLGRCRAVPRVATSCPAKDGEQPTVNMVGTAPFRIRQLWLAMTDALTRAKGHVPPKGTPQASGGGKEFVAAVNDALRFGGLMAHFVGDLAQPLHATEDYDGFGSGQGGSHNYFETLLVDSLDLRLDQEVLDKVERDHPADALFKGGGKVSPLNVAWALAIDSYAQLKELNQLDKALAVKKPSSTDKGLRIKAERQPPETVAKSFRGLITARLALGADVLARLWEAAWIEAGQPDLAAYQSYDYPVEPAFVAVDYLPK